MPDESSTQDTEAQAEVQQDVNAEGSSPTEQNTPDVEKSMVDVVEATLNPSKEGSSDSESGTEGQEADPAESAEGEDGKGESDELGELTEEEIAKYSPNSQRRIRELVSQKNDFQGQLQELMPKAEGYDKLVGYMQEHRIQPAEVDNALDINRLINAGSYDQALEKITPIYQALQQKAGAVLPEDLAEEVRLGYITEDKAQELQRLRVQQQNAQAQAASEQEQTEATNQAQAWEKQVSTAVEAVNSWAEQKKGSDPDWHQKQQDVSDQIELVISRGGAEGYPKTAEEAVAIAEEALKVVEAKLKKLRPKPTAQKAAQGHGASPRSVAQPKSMMDAIDQAIANG